jgi:hypothetical protein
VANGFTSTFFGSRHGVELVHFESVSLELTLLENEYKSINSETHLSRLRMQSKIETPLISYKA